jgi:hypothetical protein
MAPKMFDRHVPGDIQLIYASAKLRSNQPRTLFLLSHVQHLYALINSLNAALRIARWPLRIHACGCGVA